LALLNDREAKTTDTNELYYIYKDMVSLAEQEGKDPAPYIKRKEEMIELLEKARNDDDD
jgi:hypothetical protein|tara:strand:+ start:1631 stop:1807 length:177 start_codon:yes stop_codon:yes gene_type:complete